MTKTRKHYPRKVHRNKERDPQSRATYAAWLNMLHRCENPKHAAYPLYGAKGIKVDPSWSSRVSGFANFVADVGLKPLGARYEWQLYRENNQGDYAPGNVRWQKRVVVQRHTCRSRVVTWNDERMPFKDLLEALDLMDGENTLTCRLSSGWDIERILTTEIDSRDPKLADVNARIRALAAERTAA